MFWREDDGGFKWYLGVVTEKADSTNEDILVSYYKRGSKAFTRWNHPKEFEVRKKIHD